ncbi:transcriptional regulator [Faecalimonas umbilicata]|mgnify:CR=1 FL=1|uniref:transcriptional regulator n=1 Tax=Faecalimonas umbilicata TaxID=1912855 RepID=UPI0022E8A690|nr:transcriptional regulator [Faecalimonas umbilicata]
MENRFLEVFINSGMNQTEFTKFFNIPYRTVTGWKNGERSCPEYLIELMEYKLKKEKVWKE